MGNQESATHYLTRLARMKISGVIFIYTSTFVISLLHAKSFHRDRESDIFKDIFGNIKKFKKGVLTFLTQPPKIKPMNNIRPGITSNQHTNTGTHIKPLQPFVQFSSKPVFIVPTTQRPVLQTDNNSDGLNTQNTSYGTQIGNSLENSYEGPGVQTVNTSDDVHKDDDMPLYREDVIIKQLHNKKTRKNLVRFIEEYST